MQFYHFFQVNAPTSSALKGWPSIVVTWFVFDVHGIMWLLHSIIVILFISDMWNFYVHKVHLLQFLACDITILISVKEFESFSDCFSIVVLKLTHLKWSIRLLKFTVYYQNVAIIIAFFKCFPLHSPLLPSSSLVPGTQETQLCHCRQRPPVIDDDVQALYYKYKVQFEIEKEKVIISSNSYDKG